MDSLSGMSVFVLVAKTLNFSAAGRELGISPSAVGKAIGRMETKLGVRLFRRTTRTIELTDEGVLFLERCERILREVEAAETELGALASKPTPKLHINLPFAADELLRPLAAFSACHAGVEIEIDQFGSRSSPLGGEADAAICLGTVYDPSLDSRQVGTLSFIFVGSPAYLARAGTPQTACDLHRHATVRLRSSAGGQLEPWPLEGFSESFSSSVQAKVVANGMDGVLHVVLAGAGVGLLPETLVRNLIREGQLLHVLPTVRSPKVALTLVWPREKQSDPRLRSLVTLWTQPAGAHGVCIDTPDTRVSALAA
ncbi:LysR family transcriptional regulator [Roseateles noduli]|uniref:LysR family transcriptional regulator n=1 Tax=Roseateles noduli TaxID=2052484 RepID=UPI003D65A0FC